MPGRSNKITDLANRALPSRARRDQSGSQYDSFDGGYRRSPSPSIASSQDHALSSNYHGAPMQEVQYHDDLLIPPSLPFSEVTGGQYSDQSSQHSSFVSLTDLRNNSKDKAPSLSVNYVPTKFTKLHAQGDWAHRRAKVGGGRDAFAANAQRMGDIGTVDDDNGLVFQLGKGGLKTKHKPKLRWNRFKWILFGANSVLILYGLGTLISSILVWLNVFYQSDVIRVANRTELILSTIGAALITFTSLLGYSGILMNNRAFLAVYVVLLWVCLAFIAAPGYMTYKRKTFNLEGKINLQWSRQLGVIGRLRIQDALRCCGYFSPYVENTISPLCYPRSNFDGCKNRFLKLERSVLEKWYTISFALIPSHILVILAGLLCSNHVTYRFGKGLTPKRYRLDLDSMAIIMNDYASQIADQYGPGLAHEVANRSSIHINEQGGSSRPGSRAGSRRGSIGGGAQTSLQQPTSRLQYSQSSHDYNHGDNESPFEQDRSYESGAYDNNGYNDNRLTMRSDSTRYTDIDEADQSHQIGSGQNHGYNANQGWAR
ncbi:uncharacterized protein LOC62_03G004233 [Vanrija pseudolonga]|uniref:Tetraspanin Tsp2 n=1 Tax=Vanrija pseudolonga TaxID=143232 RepID=A0AAF0YAB4_9TREE|nr:hypothetical protein LOC62_03G004233 [Vanrija pseudolonga]